MKSHYFRAADTRNAGSGREDGNTQRKEVNLMADDPFEEAIKKAEEKQRKERERDTPPSAEPTKPTTPTPSPEPSPKP
jgi:hypothetical protein